MSKRYAEDIRRIVGIDPNQSSLEEAPDKESIPSKRGIGYVDPNSGAAKGVAGTPGETQLGSDIGIDIKTAGANEDNQPLDEDDPQTAADAETLVGAADIIDGNVESVTGFTAVDCDNGKDVKVNTRHDFPPPDEVVDDSGEPFVISNEWPSADTPPDIPGFEAGKYWAVVGAGSPINEVREAGDTRAIQAFIELLNSQSPPTQGPYVFASNSGGTLTLFDTQRVANFTFPITQQLCSALPPGTDSSEYCLASAKEEFWPVTDSYRLRLNDGGFSGSQYDSEVPARYTVPGSTIDFCFGAGGSRTGTAEVTKDGGFMMYETSMGTPTGNVKVYDSTGKRSAVATVDQLDSYRPG